MAKMTLRFSLTNQAKWHFKNTKHYFSIDKIIHFGILCSNENLDIKGILSFNS